MTLVDTNVLVDVLTSDPTWTNWSSGRLHSRRASGPLFINEIGYAELAVHIDSEADLQFALAELGVQLQRTPTQALFAAGKAFRRYRRAGGPRTSILPDFLIGAHAHIGGLPLLTRDARRYRTYFPDVKLIAPEEP
jgi:predicted nucleic acid-binding protein